MPKTRKFKKFVVPRYLPGSVVENVLKSDLKEYNKHRYRCFTAIPKVDTQPPPLNPLQYIKPFVLNQHVRRLHQIDKENKDMLKKINTINRLGGKVDCYNPLAYTRHSKWQTHEEGMHRIVKHNKAIYKAIVTAKSSYDNEEMKQRWKKHLEVLTFGCRYPLVRLQTKSVDQKLREQSSISEGLDVDSTERIQRPKCFMDIQVKDGVYLGRIIIELYEDFVPVTVQNFLSICCGENDLTYKNCRIHKVILGEAMITGDITLGNGKGGTSIYGDMFSEENFKLKHTKAGVLSMVKVKKGMNNSQFSISFSKLEKFDGKRVVFGKVIKGNSTLCQVHDLGQKSGVPSAVIIIANCGRYHKGQPTTPEIPKWKL